MRSRLRLALTLGLPLVCGGSILAHASASRACSCLPVKPPAEAAQNAVAVFEGTPTSSEPEGMQVRYTFEVQRVLKGELDSQVVIVTGKDSAACGRNYEIGQPYLVYAHASDQPGTLGDNLCTRTQLSSAAAEDFEVLGQGDAGESPSPSQAPEGGEPPRIDNGGAPATEPPPTQPSKRGCTVGETPHGSAPALLLVLAGLCIARRRATP